MNSCLSESVIMNHLLLLVLVLTSYTMMTSLAQAGPVDVGGFDDDDYNQPRKDSEEKTNTEGPLKKKHSNTDSGVGDPSVKKSIEDSQAVVANGEAVLGEIEEDEKLSMGDPHRPAVINETDYEVPENDMDDDETKTREDLLIAKSDAYHVKSGEYPYVVSFFTKESRSLESLPKMCLGTLIDPAWVVTASHCIDQKLPPTEYRVFGGLVDSTKLPDANENFFADINKNPQSRIVENIIFHPQAERISILLDKASEVFHYNVALLHLREPFEVHHGSVVNIVRMAALDPEDTALRKCLIFGWGEKLNDNGPVISSENILRYKEVDALPHLTCTPKADYSSLAICPGKNVPHLKSADRNNSADEIADWTPCSGDDGGPLVCNVVRANTHVKLLGISIWNGDALFCSSKSGYILLSAILAEWIETEMIGVNKLRKNRENFGPIKNNRTTFFLSSSNRIFCDGIHWWLLIYLIITILTFP